MADPVDDFLAHYGVKGMKWGIRKKDETGSREPAKKPSLGVKNSTEADKIAKEYMGIKPKPATQAEKNAALVKDHEKFLDKFDDGDPKSGGLTREQKALIAKVAVGSIAVAAVIGYSAYSRKKMREQAGLPISAKNFNSNVQHSQVKTWGLSGYVQKGSYDRPEFTLPAGHTFHRLSMSSESGFRRGTYATNSIEDFNRYVTNFRHEKGAGTPLNHITFKTSKPLKVPNLVTNLETLREVMSKETGLPVSREGALESYKAMSGGDWSSPLAKSFFSELGKKGYGAIVDEMDAGVIGESPLVVFAKEQLTPKVVQPLTNAAIKTAESSLVELTNRKL